MEYCAASDSFTYAPEGFYEFYNQRRRWTPSTMANIIDLLQSWRDVTKRNEDISVLYIFYQVIVCSVNRFKTNTNKKANHANCITTVLK